MKLNLLTWLALSLLLGMVACAGPRTSPGAESRAATPLDLELRATINDLYAAFCFDPGCEPDWELQRRIYLPGASFVPPLGPGRDPVAEDTETFLAGFRDFVRSEPFRTTGFHERIVGIRLERFADLAHALVAFEGFEPGDGATVSRGLDSIQFVHDGEAWRLASFATQYEGDGQPLPQRLLVDAPEVLTAASNMRHPPFSSRNAEGRPVGIEVDLVRRAARELGCGVRWIELPFAELLPAVRSGAIDIAASTIGITAERAETVAFSAPYFTTTIVALVAPGDGPITDLDQLANARIGADRATTAHTAAAARWPTAKLVGAVTEGSTWPAMVARGEIDAFVVDASDQSRLESESGVQLRRLATPLATEHFGLAVSPRARALRDALDRAVCESARD